MLARSIGRSGEVTVVLTVRVDRKALYNMYQLNVERVRIHWPYLFLCMS